MGRLTVSHRFKSVFGVGNKGQELIAWGVAIFASFLLLPNLPNSGILYDSQWPRVFKSFTNVRVFNFTNLPGAPNILAGWRT